MIGLADLGQAVDGPVALVVLSPGLATAAAEPLASRLERAGWDAWALDLSAADPTAICTSTMPEALAELGVDGRRVLIVGEGLGGRFAARCLSEGTAVPDGLALLGAPLDLAYSGGAPVAIVAWLAALPVPAAPLDLGTAATALWRDVPALPLMLGTPLPPLGTLSPAWLDALATDARSNQPVSLVTAPCPVFAAASPSDNLGPPESVRWRVPEGSFLRLGFLNLDPREPEHADLLTDPATARVLIRWSERLLNKVSD